MDRIDAGSTRVNQNETRQPIRLRLFLRDHRILDGSASLPRGEHLSTYLASRRRYLELTDIDWMGLSGQDERLTLKVDQILWASSGHEVEVEGEDESAAAGRGVEIELESGYLLRAGLAMADHQRLTAYLQSAPAFVPLRQARLMPRGKRLGDVVVNQAAIRVVREIPAGPGLAGAEDGEASRSRGRPSREPVSNP